MNPLWFKDWFNTPYYHLLYSRRNDEEAANFIKKLFNFLQVKQTYKILDLCCGKGRHTHIVGEMGYCVTGVDLSENNIEIANKKSCKNTSFAVHDMRQTYKDHEFDIVLNLFTSFGYFDDRNDDFKVLNSVFNSLKENGIFVLDFMNGNYVKKALVPKETIHEGEIVFNIERFSENGFIYKNINVLDNGINHQYCEKVRDIRLVEFEEMFYTTKLKLIHTFGDYSLNKYNTEISPRLIMIVVKVCS